MAQSKDETWRDWVAPQQKDTSAEYQRAKEFARGDAPMTDTLESFEQGDPEKRPEFDAMDWLGKEVQKAQAKKPKPGFLGWLRAGGSLAAGGLATMGKQILETPTAGPYGRMPDGRTPEEEMDFATEMIELRENVVSYFAADPDKYAYSPFKDVPGLLDDVARGGAQSIPLLAAGMAGGPGGVMLVGVGMGASEGFISMAQTLSPEVKAGRMTTEEAVGRMHLSAAINGAAGLLEVAGIGRAGPRLLTILRGETGARVAQSVGKEMLRRGVGAGGREGVEEGVTEILQEAVSILVDEGLGKEESNYWHRIMDEADNLAKAGAVGSILGVGFGGATGVVEGYKATTPEGRAQTAFRETYEDFRADIKDEEAPRAEGTSKVEEGASAPATAEGQEPESEPQAKPVVAQSRREQGGWVASSEGSDVTEPQPSQGAALARAIFPEGDPVVGEAARLINQMSGGQLVETVEDIDPELEASARRRGGARPILLRRQDGKRLETTVGDKTRTRRGGYLPGTDVVVIDASLPVREQRAAAYAHEFFHWLRNKAPQEWQDVYDRISAVDPRGMRHSAARELAAREGQATSPQDLANEQLSRYVEGFTGMMDVLTREGTAGIEEMRTRINEADLETRTAWRKFLDWLADFLGTIGLLGKEKDFTHQQRRVLKVLHEELGTAEGTAHRAKSPTRTPPEITYAVSQILGEVLDKARSGERGVGAPAARLKVQADATASNRRSREAKRRMGASLASARLGEQGAVRFIQATGGLAWTADLHRYTRVEGGPPPQVGFSPLVYAHGSEGGSSTDDMLEALMEAGFFPGRELEDLSLYDLEVLIEDDPRILAGPDLGPSSGHQAGLKSFLTLYLEQLGAIGATKPGEETELTDDDVPFSTDANPSEEFKAWFGGSVVVDPATGEPVVVHLGRGGPVGDDDAENVVQTEGLGQHFGDQAFADLAAGEEEGSRVLPVHLSIKNPVYMRDLGDMGWSVQGVMDALEKMAFDGVKSGLTVQAVQEIDEARMAGGKGGNTQGALDAVRRGLLDLGIDGIVYRYKVEETHRLKELPDDAVTVRIKKQPMRDYLTNDVVATNAPHHLVMHPKWGILGAGTSKTRAFEDARANIRNRLVTRGNRVWIPFTPEQVKSSMGNMGTFDPQEPDIRFSSDDELVARLREHSKRTDPTSADPNLRESVQDFINSAYASIPPTQLDTRIRLMDGPNGSWYVETLYVEEDSRGMGAGRSILELIARFADEAQVPVIGQPLAVGRMLGQAMAPQHALMQWYRRLGFQEARSPEEDRFTRGDEDFIRMPRHPFSTDDRIEDIHRDPIGMAARAVARLRREGVEFLGNQLANQMEDFGGVSLVGHQIQGHEDLAALSAVFRSQAFETFRYFFTRSLPGGGHEIVHQTGITSRMPGFTGVSFTGESAQVQAIGVAGVNAGADGYYLSHNHPSGNPEPSPEDHGVTTWLRTEMDGLGLQFRGHIIIDGTRYTEMNPDGSYHVRDFIPGDEPAQYGIAQMHHDLLGRVITDSDELQRFATELAIQRNRPDDFFHIITSNAGNGRVVGIMEAPLSLLRFDQRVRLVHLVRTAQRATGGSFAFVANIPDEQVYINLALMAQYTGVLQSAVTRGGQNIEVAGAPNFMAGSEGGMRARRVDPVDPHPDYDPDVEFSSDRPIRDLGERVRELQGLIEANHRFENDFQGLFDRGGMSAFMLAQELERIRGDRDDLQAELDRTRALLAQAGPSPMEPVWVHDIDPRTLNQESLESLFEDYGFRPFGGSQRGQEIEETIQWLELERTMGRRRGDPELTGEAAVRVREARDRYTQLREEHIDAPESLREAFARQGYINPDAMTDDTRNYVMRRIALRLPHIEEDRNLHLFQESEHTPRNPRSLPPRELASFLDNFGFPHIAEGVRNDDLELGNLEETIRWIELEQHMGRVEGGPPLGQEHATRVNRARPPYGAMFDETSGDLAARFAQAGYIEPMSMSWDMQRYVMRMIALGLEPTQADRTLLNLPGDRPLAPPPVSTQFPRPEPIPPTPPEHMQGVARIELDLETRPGALADAMRGGTEQQRSLPRYGARRTEPNRPSNYRDEAYAELRHGMSVIRGRGGSATVFYHGTTQAGFTKFDPSKSKWAITATLQRDSNPNLEGSDLVKGSPAWYAAANTDDLRLAAIYLTDTPSAAPGTAIYPLHVHALNPLRIEGSPTASDFQRVLDDRHDAIISGRIVDPDVPESAATAEPLTVIVFAPTQLKSVISKGQDASNPDIRFSTDDKVEGRRQAREDRELIQAQLGLPIGPRATVTDEERELRARAARRREFAKRRGKAEAGAGHSAEQRQSAKEDRERIQKELGLPIGPLESVNDEERRLRKIASSRRSKANRARVEPLPLIPESEQRKAKNQGALRRKDAKRTPAELEELAEKRRLVTETRDQAQRNLGLPVGDFPTTGDAERRERVRIHKLRKRLATAKPEPEPAPRPVEAQAVALPPANAAVLREASIRLMEEMGERGFHLHLGRGPEGSWQIGSLVLRPSLKGLDNELEVVSAVLREADRLGQTVVTRPSVFFSRRGPSAQTDLADYGFTAVEPGGPYDQIGPGAMIRSPQGGGRSVGEILPGRTEEFEPGTEEEDSAAVLRTVRTVYKPGSRARRSRDDPGVEFSTDDAPKRLRAWLDRKVASGRASLIDTLEGFENVNEGVLFDDAADMVSLERLRRGRTKNEIRRRVRRNYLDPIVQLMKKAELTIAQVNKYLYARHAAERNRQKMVEFPNEGWNETTKPGSGLSTKDAEGLVSELEAVNGKAFKEIGNIHDEAMSRKLDLLVRSGLLSEADAATWKRIYPHYVPLKTGFGKLERQEAPGIGRGVDIMGKESKRALGRESLADDHLAYAAADYMARIVRAEKVKTTQALYHQIKDAKGGEWFGIAKTYDAPPMTGKTAKPLTETVVDQQLYGNYPKTVQIGGYGVDAAPDPEFLRAESDGRVVHTKIGGKVRYIVFEPGSEQMAKALNRANAASANAILSGMTQVNRYLTGMITRWNPFFWPVNLVRDIPTAVGISAIEHGERFALGVARNIPRAMRIMYGQQDPDFGRADHLSAKDRDMLEEYHASGAPISLLGLAEAQEIEKEMTLELKRAINPTKLRKVARWFETASDAFENASRLAVYMQARKMGRTIPQAGLMAKEATTNFERGGDAKSFIHAWWIFANAGIQGADKFYRASKANPARAARVLGYVGAFATAWSLWVRSLLGDDDDGVSMYEKIPEYIRQSHMIIPIPGQTFDPETGEGIAMIPLPWYFNVPFVMGDKAAGVMNRDNTLGEAVGPILGSLVDAISPIGGGQVLEADATSNLVQFASPSSARPVIEAMTNRNWLGRRIYPNWDDDLPDSQKSWSGTSEHLKDIMGMISDATGGDEVTGGGIDISPESVTHVFDNYLPGLLKEIRRLGTAAWQGDVQPRNVPLARRFWIQPSGVEDYYRFDDSLKDLEHHYRLIKLYSEAGKGAQAQRIATENAQELSLYAEGKSIKKRAAVLRKESFEQQGEERRQTELQIREMILPWSRKLHALRDL